MLQVKNITKSYPGKPNALLNVEFEVKSGEVCGLIGQNGAGKSSIIRSIIGAQDVDAGEIYIEGKSMKQETLICKKALGYIPDNQALYPYLTGRQYINFVSDIHRVSIKDREQHVERYTALLGMEDAYEKVISSYSKGMKQKLLIIAALIHNPRLIIMDEPFSGLDPVTVEQLKEIIKQESKKGKAVLFSSHMLEIAEKICTQIVMIKEGIVVVDENIREKREQGRLENLFFGRTV